MKTLDPKDYGISRKAFCEATGVHYTTVARWASDKSPLTPPPWAFILLTSMQKLAYLQDQRPADALAECSR